MPVNMQILRDLVANQQVPVAVISMVCSYLPDEDQHEIMGQITPAELAEPAWQSVAQAMVNAQLEAMNVGMIEMVNQVQELGEFAALLQNQQPLNPQELGEAIDLAQGIDQVVEAYQEQQGGDAGPGIPANADDEERKEEEEREHQQEEEQRHEEEEKREEEEREEHGGH